VEVVEMPARSLATLSSRPPASVALLGVISSLSASNHESLSRPWRLPGARARTHPAGRVAYPRDGGQQAPGRSRPP